MYNKDRWIVRFYGDYHLSECGYQDTEYETKEKAKEAFQRATSKRELIRIRPLIMGHCREIVEGRIE